MVLLSISLVVATVFGALAAAFLYTIVLPRQPFHGPLPPLSNGQARLAGRLRTHVEKIASRPRNIAQPAALEEAAVYIEGRLTAFGLTPAAQAFEAGGQTVRNIEVVIPPVPDDADALTYVVGAHYDSAEQSPGANDNGTGVASLIELARQLATRGGSRHRLRLVFFVNEEEPYGKTPLMGSWRHARQLAERGERVAGMIALETLGYFSDAPASQAFPPPFGLIYPRVGNFVAFVGLGGSRRFLHRTIRAFRRHTPFPSIGGVVPGFIEGADLSDHWAYAQFGFPALMVTDTAPFRNPYYHADDDLPGCVDYDSLARITMGLELAIRDLVS